MLGYYLGLALRSLKRTPVLAALMIIAIALGVGASITMLTVLRNLAGDPLPQRSGVLFHPQVDPRPLHVTGADEEPPDNLTYIDALNLLRLPGASRRAIMSANWLPTRPNTLDSSFAMITARGTTSDFFEMFGVPFVYGSAWSAQQGEDRAHVVVLSSALNDRLFGGTDSVGRELVIATKIFRVIGVIGEWNPRPRFYDLDQAPYGDSEQMYLPFFTWLGLPQDYGYGPMQCWGNNPDAGAHNPKAPQCTWVQFWVQLDSAGKITSYRQALAEYSRQQHQLGRFERAPNVRLRSLLEWLNYKQVLPVTDVPPVLSSTAVWSPIPPPKEIGHEEAVFRRADHRLPA